MSVNQLKAEGEAYRQTACKSIVTLRARIDKQTFLFTQDSVSNIFGFL